MTGRLATVDALRGFALFGILVVNLLLFAHPLGTSLEDIVAGPVDAIVARLVHGLFEAKFYPLFSFLFGFGFAVQMERSAEDPARLRGRYWRRLAGLLVLGLAHAIFFFAGDILVSYALLGFVLWCLREREEWRLERLALGLLAVGCVLSFFIGLGYALGESDAAAQADMQAASAEALAAYHGSFAEALARRVQDLVFLSLVTPFFAWPVAMAMFAMGLAAGRAGLLTNPAAPHANLPPILHANPRANLLEIVGLRWRTVLVIAVSGNLLYALFAESTTWWPLAAVAFGALPIAGPMLAFVYARLLWFCVERHPGHWLVRALQAAGRLSLSNYLLQGVVCSWIFNGYGLGLYGQLGPAALFGLAVAVYAAQLALSALWLRAFRLGPAEWLLRALTNLNLPEVRLRR